MRPVSFGSTFTPAFNQLVADVRNGSYPADQEKIDQNLQGLRDDGRDYVLDYMHNPEPGLFKHNVLIRRPGHVNIWSETKEGEKVRRDFTFATQISEKHWALEFLTPELVEEKAEMYLVPEGEAEKREREYLRREEMEAIKAQRMAEIQRGRGLPPWVDDRLTRVA